MGKMYVGKPMLLYTEACQVGLSVLERKSLHPYISPWDVRVFAC
jgi:hypothetical protein